MAGEPTSWLQNLAIAIEVLCPVLAFVVVVLRLYIRFDIKSLGWDDALICASLTLTIGLGVGSIICIKELYIGIHYWEIPQSADSTKGMLWMFVVGTIYSPIVALTKQSVLIFLIRFSGIKSVVRNVVWVTAMFNIALTIAAFLAVVFQCRPIEASWNKSVPGKCINEFALAITTGTLTVLTDIIIVGLPFHIFLGLKMDRKKKNGVMGVFALGIIVTVVSVIRLYFVAMSFINVTPDRYFSLGFCVSQIECSLAITTASAPALWPLVRRWFSRLKSTRNEVYYNREYDTSHLTRVRTVDGPFTGGGCIEPDGRRAQTEEGSDIGPPTLDPDEEWTKIIGFIRMANSTTTKEDNPDGTQWRTMNESTTVRVDGAADDDS
ncbi:integral membrane protein [Colletotrichum zoysiae]|uniref:Integral membrane protein n=1 Tax=Colletotrichum zoysiae TaxID=1216348 RepID=A0AAD9HT21_9PEZI|nr:integral membrane protein [Colletotrichum zoysiae]